MDSCIQFRSRDDLRKTLTFENRKFSQERIFISLSVSEYLLVDIANITNEFITNYADFLFHIIKTVPLLDQPYAICLCVSVLTVGSCINLIVKS